MNVQRMSYSEGAIWNRKRKEKMDQTHRRRQTLSHDDDVTNNHKEKNHHEDREKPKRCALVSFWEAPEHMKDNEFILHYYRANWPLKESLFSLFRWHNETLNVWTYVKVSLSSKALKFDGFAC